MVTAVYLMVNAQLVQNATALGEITYLSPGEIELCREALLGEVPLQRVWEYFTARADVDF